MYFNCDMCSTSFTRTNNLRRHQASRCKVINLNNTSRSVIAKQTKKIFSCLKCDISFTRLDSLKRHQNSVSHNKISNEGSSTSLSDEAPTAKKMKLNDGASTSTAQQYCDCCKIYVTGNIYNHHRTSTHKTNSLSPLMDGIYKIRTAFKQRIASYRITIEKTFIDYNLFFNEINNKVLRLLQRTLGEHVAVKVNMEVFGRYLLPTKDMMDIKSFNTSNRILTQSTDLDSTFQLFKDAMVSQASEFQERDSGWALEQILHLEVNVNRYSPLRGSSFLKLPKCIEAKNAVVNIRNPDECCFAWAITSALCQPTGLVSSTTSYPHFSNILKLDGIEFPVKLRDIAKFEEMNNISINVYGLESTFVNNKLNYELVGPLHYTKNKRDTHINLLHLSSEGLDDYDGNKSSYGNSHYCWIRDLPKLVCRQISLNEHRKYFCDGCLIVFNQEYQLLQHQQNDCNHVYTSVPSDTKTRTDKYGKEVPENQLKFENFEKQMKAPFVVYADFESILKPIDTCQPNDQKSFTNKTYEHQPYSFSYYIKCSFDNSVSKLELYRGKDAGKVFVDRIEKDVREIYNKYLKNVVPMKPLTTDEIYTYNNAVNCGICEKPFSGTDIKVRDHCHASGDFRFGAHSICNLNYKIPYYIPIIFHNLSGYDAHLFIKELCTKNEKVDVLAQTKEKYISFSKHLEMETYINNRGETRKKFIHLRFIDSFRFLSASLENLGENLTPEQLIDTRKLFTDDEQFSLMRKKGVFPYSFLDSLDKLNFPMLPSKNEFYNKLNNEHIEDEEYERAEKVWSTFNCQNLGEYADLYLKSDVLLLCDIFENFRRISLEKYKLDPAHYHTGPSLAWDAALKMTRVELELLTDIDMIHFLKRGTRGGISQCSDRKQYANNEFLPNYNPKEPTSFIMYLDATNLYGHSMSQPLPTSGFMWLSKDEINDLDILNIRDDSPIGYALEVDVQYPSDLHLVHSDLPFLAESIIPSESKSREPKLIPNLNNKHKYIIHYRNLKQAVNHGLAVTHIHRVLKFNQSSWLKEYIDLNTEMRNRATNKFEKDLYKLMNNSVFGKTMENVDKRNDIRLVTHWKNITKRKGANSLIAHPNFKTCSIFSENFVAIHMGKVKTEYNKPIYVGFAILELSKTVIYRFYYDVLKKHFGDRVILLYTDTDSLIIKVYTENFYEFMKRNPQEFDTSNYMNGNIFGIVKGPSILGLMKDEFPADPLICFYGTGSKAYYCQSLLNELKKAKGIKKAVVQRELTIDDYKKIVESGGLIFRKMSTFRSNLHSIYTELMNKVALSHTDDKRYIIPNTTKTLPWGHFNISSHKNDPQENLDLILDVINDMND